MLSAALLVASLLAGTSFAGTNTTVAQTPDVAEQTITVEEKIENYENVKIPLPMPIKHVLDVLYENIVDKSIGIPIVAAGPDERFSALKVIISEDAPLPLGLYREPLQLLLGNDVQLKLSSGRVTPESCVSTQWSRCDPLIGGITLQATAGSGALTIPLKDTSGNRGFIMSGHVAGATSSSGNTGTDVGQPAIVNRVVGVVQNNPTLGGRDSDSAFVRLTDTSILIRLSIPAWRVFRLMGI